MRYSMRSNLAQRKIRLEFFMDGKRLDQNGRGHHIAGVIQRGIMERAAAKRAPDGSMWDRNAPATIRKKGRDDPGIDTGSMLDPQNFTGQPEVTKNTVIVKYTGNQEDKNKLKWFQSQYGNHPARRVWGLDPEIRQQVAIALRQAMKS